MSSDARLVVSRRLWNKHAHRFQNKDTATTPAAIKKEAEAPWSRNWIIFFTVSAGMLIPYFGLWFVSSNTTLREALLPVEDDSSAFMKWVRSHFGHEDLHARSYCDSLSSSNETEYRLLDEWSAKERAMEAEKRQLNNRDIRVRVGFVTNNNMGTDQLATEMKVHVLPASLPANPDIIKAKVAGARQEDALEIMTGSPVVTFLEDVDTNGEGGETSSNPSNNTATTVDSVPSNNDPLFQTHYAMSSWQVVDPAMIPNSSSNSNNNKKTSWEEIERNRLEYELQQLQEEIRMGSSRSVDDVKDELKRVQSELRKRTWKRWLPSWSQKNE